MRPQIQFLDDTEITRVINSAFRILAEIGVDVQGQALKRQLLENGLAIDPTSGRVLFPARVVESALARAPQTIDLYDRDSNHFTTLGGDLVHFVPGSSALQVQDWRDGQVRAANTSDFIEFVRITNTLEHIAFQATAFSTCDVLPDVADAWRLCLCLLYSTRPVVSGAFSANGVPRMAEMLALFRDDRDAMVKRPQAVFTITPTGNFCYGEDSCQNLLDCLTWGIPIEIVPVTLMGLIAPVTLRDALVFHTADVLAGITMVQILRPGHPVLFGGAPATFHMRTSTSPMAAIEAMKLDIAYVAVGKYLNLPTQAYMALSDGKVLDAQAGAESFGGALLAALAGINSVSGAGMLDYVTLFSIPKLIFDNELCGQAMRFIRREEGPDESFELARELLAQGHLLTSAHTLEHWQEVLHLATAVFDRSNRERRPPGTDVSLWQRAVGEVEDRLSRSDGIDIDEHLKVALMEIMQFGVPAAVDWPNATIPLEPFRQQGIKASKRQARPRRSSIGRS